MAITTIQDRARVLSAQINDLIVGPPAVTVTVSLANNDLTQRRTVAVQLDNLTATQLNTLRNAVLGALKAKLLTLLETNTTTHDIVQVGDTYIEQPK